MSLESSDLYIRYKPQPKFSYPHFFTFIIQFLTLNIYLLACDSVTQFPITIY